MPQPKDIEGNTAADGFITAEEAARLLGVNLATVYAYVSRKGLRSAPVPGSRQRRYWRADIERLRNRQARRPEPPDSDNQSEITLITPQGPFYRGQSAIALAETATFEDVACLLWRAAEPSPFAGGAPRGSPMVEAMDRLLANASAVDRASAMFPFLEQVNPRAYDLSPAGMARTGADVLRWLAAILLHRPAASDAPLHEVFAETLHLSPPLADMVRRVLVLSADHAFEPGTFAVRSVASTGVTPWRAVMAGLSVATGRRSRFEQFDALRRFLAEVMRGPDPAAPVVARLREGEPLPGFGSVVYPDGDPRGRALLDYCAKALAGEPEFDRLRAAIDLVAEITGEAPNFALASAFAEARLGLGGPVHRVGLSSTEAPFLLGRAAGWIAHAIEQYGLGEAQHRPVAYKGPLPR